MRHDDERRGNVQSLHHLASARGAALFGSVLVLVLVIVVGLWTRGERSNSDPSVFPEGRNAEALMPAEQPPEIAPPSPVISSEDGAQATREEVLAEYWGDRWPEIREALIKEGKDLSLPLHLVPWEESAPKLYEGMIDFSDEDLAMWKGHFYRWPAELTADWLVENQYISQADALTPVQIQELSDLAATLNVDIEWRVDEFLFELEAAMKSKWDSGNFEKAPVSTAGLPQAPDAFHSSASVSGSWTARVNLTRSEDPELYAKQEEIRAIVRKRTQTLRSWIRRQLEEH